MQDGCSREHKHRYVKVREDGLALRLLRAVVYTTCDREQAEKSKFAYSLRTYEPEGWDFVAFEYVLTLLGLLHGLVGLTVEYDDD